MKILHVCLLACSLLLGCKSTQPSAEQDTSPKELPTETSPAVVEDAAREDAPAPPLAAKIVQAPGEASTFNYTVIDETGGEVEYPEAIKQKVRESLFPALTLKGRAVIFDHDANLYVYVFGSEKEVQRLALEPAASALDYHWVSPGGDRVAVIQQAASGEVVLDVLRIDKDGGGEVVLHQKLEPAPMMPCGSRCSVEEASFVDDVTFRYLVRGGEQDPGDPDSPPVYETIKLPAE